MHKYYGASQLFAERESLEAKKYLFASIEFLLRLRPPPGSWHTASFQLPGNHPAPSKIKINISLGWYFSVFFTQQVNKHLSIFSQWDHFQLQGTDYRHFFESGRKGKCRSRLKCGFDCAKPAKIASGQKMQMNMSEMSCEWLLQQWCVCTLLFHRGPECPWPWLLTFEFKLSVHVFNLLLCVYTQISSITLQ